MAFIELDNVRFSYDGKTPALDGLSLVIGKGEFVCVLGANGSGKSTLAKHLNALLIPDEGHVIIQGTDTTAARSAFELRSHISMVFQNPDDQLVASIVEDEVAFGPENLGIAPAEIRERVTSALAAVGLSGFEQRNVTALSGGQKQRLAIAGALAMHPEILVLDEVGAMLDPDGRNAVVSICRDLNNQGITVVMITQDVEEALVADRVIVLDDGRIALDGTPRETLSQIGLLGELGLDAPLPMQLSYALRERGLDVPLCIDEAELRCALRKADAGRFEIPLSASHDRTPTATAGDSIRRDVVSAEAIPIPCEGTSVPAESSQISPVSATTDTTTVLGFQNVSFSYPAYGGGRKRGKAQASAPLDGYVLRNLSFDLREGECLGIVGPTGSGKSTLLQLCKGLLAPIEGSILSHDRNLTQNAAGCESHHIGIMFQYPEHQLFAQTVFDDVAFGPRNLGCPKDEIEKRVHESLEAVHLDPDELKDRSPFALSAGQQRRVAFAGVLAMQPRILLLDEPTAGLDPTARRRFLNLVAELRTQRHLSSIIVSHDMDDLAQLCDRVAILVEGGIIAQGPPACVFSDKTAVARGHLEIPGTLTLASALGLPVDHVPTVDELADLILSGRLEVADAAKDESFAPKSTQAVT